VEDKGKSLIETLKPFMLELEALKEDVKPKMPKRQLDQLRAVPQWVQQTQWRGCRAEHE
jgi:hypothetical protein